MNLTLIIGFIVKLIDLSTLIAVHGAEVLEEYHVLRGKLLEMTAQNRNPTAEEFALLEQETDSLTRRLEAAIVLKSVEPPQKVVNVPAPAKADVVPEPVEDEETTTDDEPGGKTGAVETKVSATPAVKVLTTPKVAAPAVKKGRISG